MCLRYLTLIMLSLSAVPCQAEPIREIRFSGALSQATRGDEDLILRQFEIVALRDGSGLFFSVLEEERGGSPWPESYGRFAADRNSQPRLIYQYDGSTYTITMPPLTIALPGDIVEQSTWTSDTWTYEAAEKRSVDGSSAWQIDARERRGRRQSLLVAADTGVLLQAQKDVFMGQGEKFELVLRQVSATTLAKEQSEKVAQLQSELQSLQAALSRRPDTQLAGLSARQIEETASRLESLSLLAKGTPLQESVLRIRRDIEQQQRREAQTMKRQQELLGRSAPKFSLNLVSGGSLESESLRDKVTVLHFWNYAEKPLSEPYGQVGYLEFLSGQQQVDRVQVVGIATNKMLQQADQLTAGKRTARKLIEFMNLTYPVGYDDGSLLRALGDPRNSGGKLPLWVVVSPKGEIIHYHTGFYEIDRRQGLRELSEVVAAQIK